METTNTKKSFFKSKMFIIPLVAILLFGIVAAAAILYQSMTVDVTVDEALSVSSPIALSMPSIYPGETWSENIVINNAAPGNLYTVLTWSEDTNTNGVTYVIGDGLTDGVQTLTHGINIISVSWTIDEDSPIGAFNGTITLERVASPV